MSERLKEIIKYLETLGFSVTYSEPLSVWTKRDDGCDWNLQTDSILIAFKYNNCFYHYGKKKWVENCCELDLVVNSKNEWEISTDTGEDFGTVTLGYFTEEVAKTILENLAKRKLLKETCNERNKNNETL